MRRAAALALVLVLAFAGPAAAAASCPRTTVAKLESRVMCPVCGTSLAVARDAPLARRERAFIARMVRSCRSERQIEDALVAQFGPAVLAVPPDHGFDATATLVPAAGGAAAVLAAGLLLALGRRRGRGPGPADGPPLPSRADELRLEAELERLR
jgi:cytochrome c-type biogenesis protein CcmH/NrfF